MAPPTPPLFPFPKSLRNLLPSITPTRVRSWFKDAAFQRLFQNAGLLLGGASLSGVVGLVYIALTARTLGPELFGVLMLIHTYIKTVGGLLRFQSWQAVVKYGAACLEKQRVRDFQSLITFTYCLDGVSALVGMLITMATASWVGPMIGIPEDIVGLVVLYSSMLVFFNMGTPNGLLRLLNRFDLLSTLPVIQAVVRVIGAGIGFAMGGGLPEFLLIWWLSAVVSGVALVVMGWMEARRRQLLEQFHPTMKGMGTVHEGVWRFVWSTNILSSLNVVSGQIVTLVIGAMLGPAPAGLYKIASQFARSLAKPAVFLSRSVFPEVAKLWEEGSPKRMTRLGWRAGFLAGGATALTFVVLVLWGRPLLDITVGEAYVGAYGVMLFLVLAMTIQAFGFAANPTLIALGRPDILLHIRFWSLMVYFPLLWFLLTSVGLEGVGMAAVVNSLMTVGLMVVIAIRKLAKAHALQRTM